MEKIPEGWNDLETGKTGEIYRLLLSDGTTNWGSWTTNQWWARGTEVSPVAWREFPKRDALTYHPNKTT